MVSLNGTLRRHSNIDLTDLTDALILAPGPGGSMFGVNGVGRRIVQLLEGPQTLGGIVGILVREYCVEPSQCEAEVREFLAELDQRGFIENC